MIYKDEELTEWLSGKPEHVGEYNASWSNFPDTLRWWNGKFWSVSYQASDSQNYKNSYAGMMSAFQDGIEYRGLIKNPNAK